MDDTKMQPFVHAPPDIDPQTMMHSSQAAMEMEHAEVLDSNEQVTQQNQSPSGAALSDGKMSTGTKGRK